MSKSPLGKASPAAEARGFDKKTSTIIGVFACSIRAVLEATLGKNF
jgi:hypothetical protein